MDCGAEGVEGVLGEAPGAPNMEPMPMRVNKAL